MKINIEKIQEGSGAIAVILSEQLNTGNIKEFKQLINPVLEEHHTVLLDMSGVNYVDSSALGAMLSFLGIMNNKKGQLKLFGLTKPVEAVFEMVRMHRIFSVYHNRDEALAAL